MTNLSRMPKFDVHTLVTGPFRGVGVVDSNRGSASKGELELCMVRRRLKGEQVLTGFHEGELNRATFAQFAWFRHPDGAWMSGKTRGYMAIVIHLFMGLLFSASIAQDASWWSAFALIPVVGYWLGTWMNYTGRWR